MKIYLAADHAGYDLKEKLKVFLESQKYEVKDFGALEFNADDDYPDLMHQAAKAVASDPENSRAFIMGGGGQGEAMVANRYKGVRAAVFYGPRAPVAAADIAGRASSDLYEQIRLAREHNNANVLSFGARFLSEEEAISAVKIFLETKFGSEERHARRVGKFEVLDR